MLYHMRDRGFWRIDKLLPKAGDYAIIALLVGGYCPFYEQLDSSFLLSEIDNANPLFRDDKRYCIKFTGESE